MKLQLIRHATLLLEYGGLRILVDPMLSDQGANPPIPGTPNERRNPTVGLPLPADAFTESDLVLVTHLHKDHWDDAAAALLPKTMPILCQPGDEGTFNDAGFAAARPVGMSTEFRNVEVSLTGGRHGTGEIGKAMGRVSGFVLQAKGEPTLYLAGDTIYCEEVEQALDGFKPEVVVVNAGGARFLAGDPITMTPEDVLSVCRKAPDATVVAVHMEAINHCVVTREHLRSALAATPYADRVLIPEDGEQVNYTIGRGLQDYR